MRGGKGWLVTYQHGGRGEFGVRADVEARVAVMRGQWGWAVYAVQECRAGQRLGWYDGDVVGADEWGAMGQGGGRENDNVQSFCPYRLGPTQRRNRTMKNPKMNKVSIQKPRSDLPFMK